MWRNYQSLLTGSNFEEVINMVLTDYITGQARKPSGKFGRLFAKSMLTGHWPVTQWGLSHVKVRKSDTILDIGCSGGKTVNRLAGMAPEGKVYGIDYSETSVAVAASINKDYIADGRVEIFQASVSSLPFQDNLFDLVTAVETYYFWPDLVSNLRGIRRILKPGGPLVLINETYWDERFEKRNAKWAKAGDFAYHLPDEFGEFFTEAGYSHVDIDVLPAKNWLTAMGVK
jgi:SAM-dependent methyltransferase